MRERSGVMVLEAGFAGCGFNAAFMELLLLWKEGVVGLGVDQANAACFGWAFRGVADAGAESQPESMGSEDSLPPAFPFTRRSKSISPPSAPLLDVPNALVPPKDMKSSLRAAPEPFVPESSCSFLVCSVSTRDERLLMRSMNDWNCFRSRSGPKLMLHNTGRMSKATKSASATPPTCLKTLSAAIATAGSFVLIALMRGRIFSCIVYLSKAVEELFLLALGFMIPSRPSLLDAGSFVPPQSVTNASNPRTLIPRLLVLVKTEAMTGNSSFLIVEKSSTGRTIGRLRSEASTML